MEYGIGLDIGIASVGWSVLGLKDKGEPFGIVRLGVRVFDKAEQPKTGESLAAPRRTARSARRRLRRKALRKADVYALLQKSGLPGKQELATTLAAGHLEDVYALRTRALDEAVLPIDFSRILLHLCQRRGFKSNRKSGAEDQEEGRLLAAVSANRMLMQQKGYRTVGEMFYRDDKFAAQKRNKSEAYLATVGRDLVAEEAMKLFAAQREKGNAVATPELEADYLSILLRQRTFDAGPGGNSPYGGNQIENRIGRCTLETDPPEPRAAKATYSFEYFTLLERINHIRLQSEGTSRPLTTAERGQLVELAHKTPDLTYAKIRKELAVEESIRFPAVRYTGATSPEACEKKTKFFCLKAYHTMRKALNGISKDHIRMLSIEQRDAIGNAFSIYKNEDNLRAALQGAKLEPCEVEELLKMPTFSGFGHISVKACRKLIPYLENGMNYSEACTKAGYQFKGHDGQSRGKFLPAQGVEMEEITSPVVRRAVAQTIKVINAIIREQNQSPAYVNIELARELSKNFSERDEMDKSMQENASRNERLMQELREDFHMLAPTGQDLVRYRLWKEQDGRCAYSLQVIPAERLFEAGMTDIDHIVPYSISFDDTRANKVLVLSEENRQKGNRLPLQYLQGTKRENFIVWVGNQYKGNYRKRRNLLKEKMTEDDQQFMQRNLQDTQHMAVFLYNYVADHLQFSNFPQNRKRRIVAVSGAITSHLRKRWGLTKVRADGDTHHAMDAVVIGCTTQQMVQVVSKYYHRLENEYEQVIKTGQPINKRDKRFPEPWPHFRDELIQRLSDSPQENLQELNPAFYRFVDLNQVHPVFVSRMPCHKATGPAHKETIKSVRHIDEGILVSKQPLTSLKLDKEGEIANYYQRASDTLLYAALKERLLQYGGDAKKAFAEPFYKPKADGTPGPLVRKVKLVEKSTLNVLVHDGQGAAANDTMVRIDVFYILGEGYYWVPIYVADTLKPELPNKAVVAYKAPNEWKEMQDKDFLFSLYANDLVRITHKKENGLLFTIQNKGSTLPPKVAETAAFAYFTGANISVASIGLRSHDNAYLLSGLGVKTLKEFKKYQVDVLGTIAEVKHETRQAFHR